MPSSPNYKRDYKQEYRNYDGKPSVKKKRAKRNKARRTMERKGKVRKGDGKDVNHKRALSKGGSNSSSNWEVVSARSNRSYRRTSSGKMR